MSITIDPELKKRLQPDRGLSKLFHKPDPDLVASLIAAGATASDAQRAAKNTKTSERAFDYAAALREQRAADEVVRLVAAEAPCGEQEAALALQRWGDQYLAVWGVRHRGHLQVDSECPFCAQEGPTRRPLTKEEKQRKEWAEWQAQVDRMDPATRASYLAEVEAQRRQDEATMMMALAAHDQRRARRRRRNRGFGAPGMGMGMGLGAGAGIGMGMGMGMGGGFGGGDCGGGGGGFGGGGCGGGGGGGC